MNESKHIIQCIGKDGLKHYCYAYSDKTLCNQTITTKKLLKNDYKRFSCCECDYRVETICGD